MINLTKIAKGKYYDKISSRRIFKINDNWIVMNECTGYVYFSSNTLTECKKFQIAENEISSWNY
jgi:hypothetical protein